MMQAVWVGAGASGHTGPDARIDRYIRRRRHSWPQIERLVKWEAGAGVAFRAGVGRPTCARRLQGCILSQPWPPPSSGTGHCPPDTYPDQRLRNAPYALTAAHQHVSHLLVLRCHVAMPVKQMSEKDNGRTLFPKAILLSFGRRGHSRYLRTWSSPRLIPKTRSCRLFIFIFKKVPMFKLFTYNFSFSTDFIFNVSFKPFIQTSNLSLNKK